ncbi:MAG: hypothetical protein CVU71_04865 [Deltaproteobacteria bacterium HGW-Deltaproteobacteria-6]|jgi:tetratricopeptide (TPR) repeat protein|nr:MAG: hypothetical protein CVU71_04865 [Deltaproteobacteria bacterium HGW-Deltaproteobacteria-6]
MKGFLCKKFYFIFSLIIFSVFLCSCEDYDKYYINLGNSRLSSGKLDRAKEYFEHELKRNKDSAEAYFGLGSVALAKKEYPAAIDLFTKVIGLNPNLAGAYFNRGLAWKEIGDIEKAIVDINKGMEINPGHPLAYGLRGDIYFDKKEYDLAIADYDKALTIDQKNEWLYLKRANYWFVIGNFKNSIFDLEKAFKLNPSNITALNDYAWLLATCSEKPYRNGEKSVQLAEKAVVVSRSAGTLDTLAAAYAETGRFEDAVKIQEESINIQKKTGSNVYLSASIERLKSYRGKIAWTDYSRKTFEIEKVISK